MARDSFKRERGVALPIHWLLVGLLVVFVSAECSKPTKPTPLKYNVFVSSSTGRIDIYDADSLAIMDSILQPRSHVADPVAVSPDGRSLYEVDTDMRCLTSFGCSVLSRIDTQSRHVVWSKEILTCCAQLLGDGKLLLVGSTTLSAEDGSFIRNIGDSIVGFQGPASGTKVAALIRDGTVIGLDVKTLDVWGRYTPRLASGLALGVHAAYLHPDGRRVLIIGIHDFRDNAWFVVGDLQSDQTLFECRVNSSDWGQIEVTSDGSLALLTDPESGGNSGAEPSSVRIIDLSREVLVKQFVTGSGQLTGEPVSARCLPDDSRAVMVSCTSDTCQLQMIDLSTLEIVKTRLIPLLTSSQVAVGPQP